MSEHKSNWGTRSVHKCNWVCTTAIDTPYIYRGQEFDIIWWGHQRYVVLYVGNGN